MSESFSILDSENKEVFNSYHSAACFVDLHERYGNERTWWDKAKYLRVNGGFASYPTQAANIKQFSPFIAALEKFLQLKIILGEPPKYKIEIDKYPADCVMTFLRSMSIINEGNTQSFTMELFQKLLDKKIHPNLAVVCCVLIGAVAGSKESISINGSRYATGHSPLYEDNITVRTFRALQSGQWKLNPQQKTMVEQRGFKRGFATLIGDHQMVLSDKHYSSQLQGEKMEKAKFHPLEIPVLYLMQFKYGPKCTIDQYISTVEQLAMEKKYGYGESGDWLYYVNYGLGRNNW